MRAMLIGSVITVVATVGLLLSIFGKSRMGSQITKPIASTGFLFVAVMAGAFHSTYGIIIFVALVLSWFGDVLLLSKQQKFFLMGLGSFLLGHLAFAIAFVTRGVDWQWCLFSFLCIGPIALLVVRWLRPHVNEAMWKPVVAYIFVIALMGTASFAAYPADRLFLIPLAAIMFMISDLAVARDRFITQTPLNPLWGLPLYYGAQLVFAYSISLFAN